MRFMIFAGSPAKAAQTSIEQSLDYSNGGEIVDGNGSSWPGGQLCERGARGEASFKTQIARYDVATLKPQGFHTCFVGLQPDAVRIEAPLKVVQIRLNIGGRFWPGFLTQPIQIGLPFVKFRKGLRPVANGNLTTKGRLLFGAANQIADTIRFLAEIF